MSNWVSLGVKTVGPNDLKVVVGSFTIEEGDDTIWVEVQRTNPAGSWPWSYGILSWQTSFGLEFGSVKAYTSSSGEIFRLGVGRTPRSRTGRIVYEPRAFNLAWVQKGYSLTLDFAASSGVTAASPLGSTSVAFSVVDRVWQYASSSGLLNLK